MIIGIDASRANHPQKTGVEWYAWHIIQELKKVIPESHEVRLYTDVPLTGSFAVLPPHWHEVVLSWPPKRLWTQARLSWEMFRRPPDLLFVPAHVLPLIHPKHSVMTVHDMAGARYKKAYSWFERWYSVFAPKAALKSGAALIVPSEHVKKDVLELIASGEKTNRILVIAHGVREDFLETIPGEEIANVCIDYSLSDPFFLYTGRIEEKKNIVGLLKAYTQFRRETTEVCRLVLVGKPGYGYDTIRRAIEEHPYRQDILELGWVETKTLVALFRAARAFVYPSWYEGFGLPLLEAFASGTPVIASTAGSLKEVGGDAYLSVAPEDTEALAQALVRMMKDDTLVKTLVMKGVDRVRPYRWQESAKQTWQLLLEESHS